METNNDYLTGASNDDYVCFLVLVRDDVRYFDTVPETKGTHVLATRQTFDSLESAKAFVKGLEFRDPIIVPCLLPLEIVRK